MALVNTVAKIVTKPLARTVTPKTHGIVNLIIAGSFLAGAGLFWRRNKRAAVAAMLCGAAEIAVTLLTDSPVGLNRIISLRTRREIDAGLAAMFASMPQFLAFNDEREKRFFLIQGGVLTALAEITQFPEREQPAEWGHAKAA